MTGRPVHPLAVYEARFAAARAEVARLYAEQLQLEHAFDKAQTALNLKRAELMKARQRRNEAEHKLEIARIPRIGRTA
jgi:hypothetical protein